jgi:hypothetical protein
MEVELAERDVLVVERREPDDELAVAFAARPLPMSVVTMRPSESTPQP